MISMTPEEITALFCNLSLICEFNRSLIILLWFAMGYEEIASEHDFRMKKSIRQKRALFVFLCIAITLSDYTWRCIMSNSVQVNGSTSEEVATVVEPFQAHNAPPGDSAGFTPYSPPPAEKAPSFPKWWIIVLIILAAPMLLALLSIPFSIIMAIASFIFALAVTGVSLIGAGIASLISVPFVMATEFGSAVFIGGMGLMSIGFGIIFLIVNIKLVKVLFKGLKFVRRRLLKREGEHGQGYNGRFEHGRQQ